MPNIYLTPNFLETQRAKGIQNNVLADFIGKNMPDVLSEVQMVRQKYGQHNEDAVRSYLDWKVYGTSQPLARFSPETEQPPQEGSMLSTIGSYLEAPGSAFAGGAVKGIGALTGMDVSGNQDVQNLPANLKKSATVARIGVPVAAGIATGGLSIPASAAISGAAGAAGSLAASGLEAAAGEDQTLGGALGEAATSGLMDAGIDAATMGLFRLVKPLVKAKSAKNLSQEAAATVGKIIQGNADDIAKGRKALQSFPTDGIKTYDDLAGTLDERVKTLTAIQNDLLSPVPGKFTHKALEKTVTVGSKSAKQNFVKQALDGLEELYGKTGEAEDLLRIQNLKETAEGAGLSVKELNDIAREYGRGFKAFSDATGQPLTSVNPKLYENVRRGVKETSRSIYKQANQPKSLKDAAEFFGKSPEEIMDVVGSAGDDLKDIQGAVTKKFGKSYGDFIGKMVDQGADLGELNAAEQWRMAAKDAVHRGVEALDSEISSLIRTRELAQDMAEKVQILANKVEKRGIGERIGRAIGKALDFSTMGAFRGFVSSFVPSNVGMKSLNSIGIEKNLVKNLTKLDKILEQVDSLPKEKAIGVVKQLLSEMADPAELFGKTALKAGRATATDSLNE